MVKGFSGWGVIYLRGCCWDSLLLLARCSEIQAQTCPQMFSSTSRVTHIESFIGIFVPMLYNAGYLTVPRLLTNRNTIPDANPRRQPF